MLCQIVMSDCLISCCVRLSCQLLCQIVMSDVASDVVSDCRVRLSCQIVASVVVSDCHVRLSRQLSRCAQLCSTVCTIQNIEACIILFGNSIFYEAGRQVLKDMQYSALDLQYKT